MITSKPAIHDHFKTGQRTSTPDTNLFYLAGYCSGKLPRFMVTAQADLFFVTSCFYRASKEFTLNCGKGSG